MTIVSNNCMKIFRIIISVRLLEQDDRGYLIPISRIFLSKYIYIYHYPEFK